MFRHCMPSASAMVPANSTHSGFRESEVCSLMFDVSSEKKPRSQEKRHGRCRGLADRHRPLLVSTCILVLYQICPRFRELLPFPRISTMEAANSETTADADAPDQARPRQHVGHITREAATYKRKKTTSACQVCRARRTKCDNARPCASCQANGYECVSSDSPRTDTWDPATMRILERMDHLQNQMTEMSRSLATSLQTGSSTASMTPQSSSPPHVFTSDNLYPQNLEAVLQWTPLRQLENVSAAANGSERSKFPPRTGEITRSQNPDLEYSTCRRLLDAFFAHVHPKNPILDEATVQASVKKACFDGFSWDTEHAVLLAVLAIGSLAMPFGDARQSESQPDMDYAYALYSASQKRFVARSASTYIVQAKYLFYSGVFQMSVLRPFDAWRSFLQALAICQGFEILSRTQSDQPESRHRDESSLYWSCWKSERELRGELGLPDFPTTGQDHPRLYVVSV